LNLSFEAGDAESDDRMIFASSARSSMYDLRPSSTLLVVTILLLRMMSK
jgi:hypothetical protein